jgi:hypothetical protein
VSINQRRESFYLCVDSRVGDPCCWSPLTSHPRPRHFQQQRLDLLPAATKLGPFRPAVGLLQVDVGPDPVEIHDRRHLSGPLLWLAGCPLALGSSERLGEPLLLLGAACSRHPSSVLPPSPVGGLALEQVKLAAFLEPSSLTTLCFHVAAGVVADAHLSGSIARFPRVDLGLWNMFAACFSSCLSVGSVVKRTEHGRDPLYKATDLGVNSLLKLTVHRPFAHSGRPTARYAHHIARTGRHIARANDVYAQSIEHDQSRMIKTTTSTPTLGRHIAGTGHHIAGLITSLVLAVPLLVLAIASLVPAVPLLTSAALRSDVVAKQRRIRDANRHPT